MDKLNSIVEKVNKKSNAAVIGEFLMAWAHGPSTN